MPLQDRISTYIAPTELAGVKVKSAWVRSDCTTESSMYKRPKQYGMVPARHAWETRRRHALIDRGRTGELCWRINSMIGERRHVPRHKV